jgi:hypothetical protein
VAERVERLTADWPNGREVLLVELTDWLWPPEAKVEWFTAFIAADAREVSDETIRSLATAMLAQRCATPVGTLADGLVRGNSALDDDRPRG